MYEKLYVVTLRLPLSYFHFLNPKIYEFISPNVEFFFRNDKLWHLKIDKFHTVYWWQLKKIETWCAGEMIEEITNFTSPYD